MIVELQTGTKLVCPIWSKIAGAWVSIGAHEPELFFVADVTREGDFFVDVGANIGVYALTAALVGARALAFEPNQQAANVIVENAKLNGVSDCLTLSADALADYDGEAAFTVDRDCSNQLTGEGAGGRPVRVRKLDTVIEEYRVRRVDILKIDAEGFDEQVLGGAVETLRTLRPTVIVEIWGGGVAVRDLLESYGYRVYHYDPGVRRLEELTASFRGQGNLVAVHATRLQRTLERLASAPPRPLSAPRLTWSASAVV